MSTFVQIWLVLILMATCVAAQTQTTVVTTSPTPNTVPVFGTTSGSNTPVSNSPITVSNGTVGVAAPLNVTNALTGASGVTNYFISALENYIGATDGTGSSYTLNLTGNMNGGNSLNQFHELVVDTYNNLSAGATAFTQSGLSVGNRLTNAGSSTNVFGVSEVPILTSTGSFTTNRGFNARSPQISGGGSIGTSYGVYVENQGSAGTTNAYGLYIENQSGSPTSNYSLYSAGGTNYFGGSVNIGTTGSGAKLEVNGSVKLTPGSGATLTYADGTIQTTAWTGVLCGGDYAEAVDVTGDRTKFGPGDVLVIDPDNPDRFLKSAEPYSTAVLGVYSTKPGVLGRHQTGPKSDREVPMAMIGIVPTKVSAENGPIRPGDLLVTSSMPGYAMKGTDRSRMLGTVIGKALGRLDSGTGVVEVGVTLQ